MSPTNLRLEIVLAKNRVTVLVNQKIKLVWPYRFSVLRATESWAEPGNKASGRVLLSTGWLDWVGRGEGGRWHITWCAHEYSISKWLSTRIVPAGWQRTCLISCIMKSCDNLPYRWVLSWHHNRNEHLLFSQVHIEVVIYCCPALPVSTWPLIADLCNSSAWSSCWL